MKSIRMSLLFACVVGLTAPAQPQDRIRIVSIGGAVTEILFALGAESDIVDCDSTSDYPSGNCQT